MTWHVIYTKGPRKGEPAAVGCKTRNEARELARKFREAGRPCKPVRDDGTPEQGKRRAPVQLTRITTRARLKVEHRQSEPLHRYLRTLSRAVRNVPLSFAPVLPGHETKLTATIPGPGPKGYKLISTAP